MNAYGYLHGLAAGALASWKAGAVTLTRTTTAPSDPETPWTPGAPTTTVFALDAVVKGVAAEFIDGTTVIATDLMVVASPIARLAGGPIAIEPTMSDTLQIDGETKVIKQIKPSPASGEAAVFRIFVAS